jgi:hypothetical protein
MGRRRRRVGVLAGSGVMALGIAALVAAAGVFTGAPAAPSSAHRAAATPTTH